MMRARLGPALLPPDSATSTADGAAVAAALVHTPDGLRRLHDAEGEAFAEIKAIETRYETLWRLYVFAPTEIARRAAPAAADTFGLPSEYTFTSVLGHCIIRNLDSFHSLIPPPLPILATGEGQGGGRIFRRTSDS